MQMLHQGDAVPVHATVVQSLKVFERYPDADVFLRCFLEVLKNAEDQGLATLPDFLAHWQEKGEEEKVPMPEGIDAVRIMTVHKSKGLEAPVVLLPWTDATLKASDPVRKSASVPAGCGRS